MHRTDVIVVGAGPAGLAISACLSRHGVPHAVLERGRIAARWRLSSWDSLRLLTPNWLNRLPNHDLSCGDPDGFMERDEWVATLETYAAVSGAPVIEQAAVLSARRVDGRFLVETRHGLWKAAALVVATGQCAAPRVPAFARQLSPGLFQIAADAYRRPDVLPAGGVLVIGASASGLQIAEEIQRSGRQVTLAVGRHTRLPRRYRGRDIFWWVDRLGMLDDRAAPGSDLEQLRTQPSSQLAGHPATWFDLGMLRDAGARIVGRAVRARGDAMEFAGDLAETTFAADHRLARLLDQIDRFADSIGAPAGREAYRPLTLDGPSSRIDLAREDIASVIWATGHAPRYPWLDIPVLDDHGEIVHDGGVTAVPGLYAIGLRWLRRRSSSFITGIGRDAVELAEHLTTFLRSRGRLAA